MALKRLTQAMATISAGRRRDIYIFIAANRLPGRYVYTRSVS
jgi:hypothetical protein